MSFNAKNISFSNLVNTTVQILVKHVVEKLNLLVLLDTVDIFVNVNFNEDFFRKNQKIFVSYWNIYLTPLLQTHVHFIIANDFHNHIFFQKTICTNTYTRENKKKEQYFLRNFHKLFFTFAIDRIIHRIKKVYISNTGVIGEFV